MKKNRLVLLFLLSIVIFSCSSDDDGGGETSQNNCQTCEIDLLGTPLSTEYCDNGDGTITATVQGVEQTIDLGGQSFADFISGQELAGATCD